MKYLIPFAILLAIAGLLLLSAVNAQPDIPDDPPPTYTPVPQCAAWLGECATPFFEIVPEPEPNYNPTAIPVFIVGLTVTVPQGITYTWVTLP